MLVISCEYRIVKAECFTTRENEAQKYSNTSAIDNINRLKTENALLKSANPEPKMNMNMNMKDDMKEDNKK